MFQSVSLDTSFVKFHSKIGVFKLSTINCFIGIIIVESMNSYDNVCTFSQCMLCFQNQTTDAKDILILVKIKITHLFTPVGHVELVK